MSRTSERGDVDDQHDLLLVSTPVDRLLTEDVIDRVVVDRPIARPRMVADDFTASLVIGSGGRT